MAINFSQQVHLHTYDTFARPVTFTPKVGLAFSGRGIYTTEELDVLSEDNSIFSDQKTILDIRDEEFTILPIQKDQLSIPTHIGMPDLGSFEILDTKANGGGETTLYLRKLVVSKP